MKIINPESTKAIEIFNQNNITGFDLRPIQDYKMRTHLLDSEYFQIVSTNVFPPLSPKTKLVKKMPFHFTDFRVYVKDGFFYYNKEALNNVLDFNASFEVFGSSGGSSGQPQKLWIVTNRTRKILINDLKQHKRDFIPVILVDENGEIKKESC